ncbi:MAG: sorbosone dehydrogenase family protein, partial [Halobacteriaceae archaeon]
MRIKRRDVLGSIGSAATIGIAGCTSTPSPKKISLEPIAKGLVSPTQLTFDPSSGKRYVVDQIGTIHSLGDNGTLESLFLDFRDRVVVSGERGLLGLAFHPNFPDDPRIFLRYSVPRRHGT